MNTGTKYTFELITLAVSVFGFLEFVHLSGSYRYQPGDVVWIESEQLYGIIQYCRKDWLGTYYIVNGIEYRESDLRLEI